MSAKDAKGFAQHAQCTVQDAANSLGKAAQQGVNQVTDAGQKGQLASKNYSICAMPQEQVVDQTCKVVKEGVDKATEQAANAVSGLDKKFGLKK